MKLLSAVIAFSCIALALTAKDSDMASQNPPSTTSARPPTTFSLPIEDDEKPTTKPKTTTTEPTTKTQAPTTTTKAPKTTTAPSVDVPVLDYNFTKPNSTDVCLLARFGAQFVDRVNNETWNVTRGVSVDQTDSSCNRLTVNFDRGTFTIQFNMTSKKSYYIKEIVADLKHPDVHASVDGQSQAKATNGSSFLCKSGLKFDLSNNVTLHMTEVQLQPYYVKDGKFATAQNCESDLSPIVPIIVGAVLAGLVVIVIIAYFIGRSRNRVGYEEI